MYRTGKRAEKRVAVVLALTVFSLGLVISYAVYHASTTRHQRRVAEKFEDSIRHYAFLVQRQLDVYASASQSLGGFMSASDDVRSDEFESFVKESRYFERLASISSVGYLPRVPAQAVAAFEREAALQFPGFRIRDAAPAADHYPLLYGVFAAGKSRADAVRGIDFASSAERLAAIRAAQAEDGLAATPVLTALKDPSRKQVLLTFAPAKVRRQGAGVEAPGGVVFTAIGVRSFFEGIDDGRVAGLFDLEVFAERQGRKILLYDADGVPQAGTAAAAPLSAYPRTLRFANQTWEAHFFAKPAYLAANADRQSMTLLFIGVLLSLIAAYLAFRIAGLYVGRQTNAALVERFDAFFQAHPFAVYALDRDHRFVFANRKLVSELGIPKSALIGRPACEFIVEENRKMAADYFREVLTGHAVAYNSTVVDAGGARSDLAVVLIPIISGSEVIQVLGFAENITERKRNERELHESRQKLQLVLDTVPMQVYWKDLDGIYQGANQRLLDEAGLERVEQIIGRSDHELAWRDLAPQYQEEDRQVTQGGIGMFNRQQARRRDDGTLRWLEVSKVPLKDHRGTVVGLLGMARDITVHKQMEAELLRRANHDSLTGLPNRAFFYAELGHAIRRAERQGGILALMYFDIDRFKLINDTYGHDAGDEVIRTFAARVRGAVRDADFVARLGGDEFVMVLEDLDERGDGSLVAEKIIAAMEPPFAIGTHTHQVSTSIGIACLEEGMSADRLLKAADDAMYLAKRAGRNCYRMLEISA